MIQLGRRQELVVKIVNQRGAILTEEGKGGTQVFLPKEELKEGTKSGYKIEVYVYKGSDNEYLGTVKETKASVGEIKRLRVNAVTNIGAFLDISLPRDVLLPKAETVGKLVEGQWIMAYLYVDKTGRLAATMKIKPYLKNDPKFKRNDWVDGVIYSSHPQYGYFVIADGGYDSLIPRREVRRLYEIGEEVKLRVERVLPDGKLVLSPQERTDKQMPQDAKRLLSLIIKAGGRLEVGDKSSPIVIMNLTKMSKGSFKRAAGNLYKAGEIYVGDNFLALKKKR
ncbi:MAG: RNA-binding protein [Tissierellia bacterium]|nr:RNA-binding protein [Tissierellia bacterium]